MLCGFTEKKYENKYYETVSLFTSTTALQLELSTNISIGRKYKGAIDKKS